MDFLNLNDINHRDFEYYTQFTIANKLDLKTHSHEKDQLLYAEGGILHVFTDNKHWYLPGRCFMWIPAGVAHSIISHSVNINLYCFYFDTSINSDDFYKDTKIYMTNDMLREMFRYTKTWNGSVDPTDASHYYLMKAIHALLPKMNSSFPLQYPYPKDSRLIEIALFLNKNLHKSYTLEQVSVKFGISTRTLSRLFKEDIGLNYVKFLRGLRISKSLELMAENKYNVYEIALQVGYSSLSAFSTIFYNVVGIRPAEYMAKTRE